MAARTLVTMSIRETGDLQAMRATLREALEPRADELVVGDVLVATQEAVTNSLRSTSRSARAVKVRLQLDDDVVWVEVEDRGRWLPAAPAACAAPPLETTHGRGLYLMRNLMDVVEISSRGAGSLVRMAKRLAV